MTIKAIATKSGMTNSSIASGTWTIDKIVPTVSISTIPTPYISGNTGAINSKNVNWSSNRNGSYTSGSSCSDGTVLFSGTATSGVINTETIQASLQYKVVRSLSNNISSVAAAESNGTVVQDWTTDIATVNVTSLTASTTYYFNVLVKDGVENKGIYGGKSEVTLMNPPSSLSYPNSPFVYSFLKKDVVNGMGMGNGIGRRKKDLLIFHKTLNPKMPEYQYYH